MTLSESKSSRMFSVARSTPLSRSFSASKSSRIFSSARCIPESPAASWPCSSERRSWLVFVGDIRSAPRGKLPRLLLQLFNFFFELNHFKFTAHGQFLESLQFGQALQVFPSLLGHL